MTTIIPIPPEEMIRYRGDEIHSWKGHGMIHISLDSRITNPTYQIPTEPLYSDEYALRPAYVWLKGGGVGKMKLVICSGEKNIQIPKQSLEIDREKKLEYIIIRIPHPQNFDHNANIEFIYERKTWFSNSLSLGASKRFLPK